MCESHLAKNIKRTAPATPAEGVHINTFADDLRMPSEEPCFFSFSVAPGMVPGDLVRARTPGGLMLEVTVPEGAMVDDIVQFAVPPVDEEANVAAAGGGADESASVVAKLKEEVRVNVRDIDESGVTNAFPRLAFSIRVTEGMAKGQAFVAELPGGVRVAVTVPSGARPGRELFFSVSAAVVQPGGAVPPIPVLMKCAL
jgi:hypothetical protein